MGLDDVRGAPVDHGRVELLVLRPTVGERETPQQVRLDVVEGVGGDQADVGAARGGPRSLGLELVTRLVQVDLGGAEGQCPATVAERHRSHAQDLFVEGHGGVDVRHRQHQVVKPVDPHRASFVTSRPSPPWSRSQRVSG